MFYIPKNIRTFCVFAVHVCVRWCVVDLSLWGFAEENHRRLYRSCSINVKVLCCVRQTGR